MQNLKEELYTNFKEKNDSNKEQYYKDEDILKKYFEQFTEYENNNA